MWSKMNAYSQKKLRMLNIIFNILYFLLTFVAPLITVLVFFYSTDSLINTKVSLVFVFIAISIVFASTRFLKKIIEKISIYKLDGTYNDGMRTFKHIALMLSHLIIPITILIISIVFATALKEHIDVYVKLVIICLSFYLGGLLVDGLVLSFLDDELSIREKTKEQAAIALRKDIQ